MRPKVQLTGNLAGNPAVHPAADRVPGGPGGSAESAAEDIDVALKSFADGTTVVLKGARLLDANYDGELLDVKIQDGIIMEVGSDLEGDETIDLNGYTLMPGLIDSHVHIAGSAGYNLANLKRFSTQGITSVREEGMLSTENEEDYVPLIEASNADPASAFLVSCGKYLDEEGGYGMGPTGNMGIVITNAEEAAAEIEHKAQLGYQQAKVGINSDEKRMTPEEFTAIMETAHKLDMYVAAHIGTSAHIEELTAYGIDEAAHTPLDAMSGELIASMVENGVAMNTSGAENVPEIKIDNLKRFYEAGGFITVGTDKMRGYDTCIDSLVNEMKTLSEAGLNVQEVVACTTYNNALVLGINAGLIAEGYEADLIAVQGDVDGTFEALLGIDFIMNDGAVINAQS